MFTMLKSFFIEHSHRNGTCPIFKTHDTTHYPDKFADREILELKAICVNKENGCNWSNSLRNLEVWNSCIQSVYLCDLILGTQG